MFNPTSSGRGEISIRSAVAVVLGFMMLLAACSNDDGSDATASDNTRASAEDSGEVTAGGDLVVGSEADEGKQAESPAVDAENGAGAGGLSDTAALQPIDIGRDIIFTAVISVEVVDVPAASQQAMTAIQGLGGILYGQNATTDGVPRSTLTFKVPPKDFQTALARLGEIGFLRDQQVSADDVTERVVDLQSQIITWEASVARLRGFLEGATTLPEIAELERQLLDRETNLERLRGSLRTVQDQVSLATITLTMTQKVPGPELEVIETGYFSRDGDITCPGEDDLDVDEGDLVTVCYVITNTGDTLLGELFIRDEGLDIDLDDMTVVAGSLDSPLAVGASVVLSAEVTAEPFTTGRAQVTAVTVSDDGTDLRFGSTSARGDFNLTVEEDTSLPGFLDGLSAGFAVLLVAIEVFVVSLGFLLPFIWVIPVLWWLNRWNRRRKAKQLAAAHEHLSNIPPPSAPAPDGGASNNDEPNNDEPNNEEPNDEEPNDD